MRHATTFGARNTVAVIAGLVPVAALFLLSAVLYSHERRAPIVEVRPATAIGGIPAAEPFLLTRDGGLLIDRREIAGREVRVLGETLDDEDLTSKRAFCTGRLACLGYKLMLFETHQREAPARQRDTGTVVVRPRAFAANPFWPYLDDLELAFFAGVIAGGMGASWQSALARKAPS